MTVCALAPLGVRTFTRMHGQPLFDKVVELCGVSAVLAPGLVRRSLDGKVTVEEATAAHYLAALPRLLARLRAYMPEEDAQRRARRISGMLQSIDAGRAVEGEDEGDWSLIGRVTDALRSGTPASGTPRSAPPSGEVTLPDYDADEPTLMGRRYTAHEREVLRETGVVDRSGRPDSKEIDLSRLDDVRKTRR